VDGVQDGVTPSRAAIFATNPGGRTVDAFMTHDLVYRVNMGWETTVTASVFNLLDEEPSFARLDLSYDPFIANPLGRYWKVGVNKRF
jgi:iron complex outermembrane receptor protein